jgi:hypothetical protein
MSVATYTFLPWLRRGVGNLIQVAAGTGSSHATFAVSLAAKSNSGQTAVPPVTVHLVGPGDIAGMYAQQVICTEPRRLVTDFEPNYLAAVDFYDEDFPWRYSPVGVDGATHRLTPRLALVVLKDEEFQRVAAPGRPLPTFDLMAEANRGDLFPKPLQEWAWAHVQLNEALGPLESTTPDLGVLKTSLDSNPDIGYARLLCPRKLDPNTRYTAFVVPVFEFGLRVFNLPVARARHSGELDRSRKKRQSYGGGFGALLRQLSRVESMPVQRTAQKLVFFPGHHPCPGSHAGESGVRAG